MTDRQALKIFKIGLKPFVELTGKEYDLWVKGYDQATKVIITALEKQIPKKPKDRLTSPISPNSHWWVCPVCGEDVDIDDGSVDIMMKYCCMCGQKIDWQG